MILIFLLTFSFIPPRLFLRKACQGSDPVILVAFSSWSYSLYYFLLESMQQPEKNDKSANNTLSNVQGIISILPTIIHDPMIQFLTLPLFLLLKAPVSETPQYQAYSTTNPNAIVVHNSRLQFSQEAENRKHSEGLQMSAQEVWISRTIAMYAEAVTSMNDSKNTSPSSGTFRRLPPARL